MESKPQNGRRWWLFKPPIPLLLLLLLLLLLVVDVVGAVVVVLDEFDFNWLFCPTEAVALLWLWFVDVAEANVDSEDL